MIAAELAERLGFDDLAIELGSVEAITDAIASSVPAFAGATRVALRDARDGVLAVPPGDMTAFPTPSGASSRAPERISYDYRLVVTRRLYDQAVLTARSPSLAPLARPAAAHIHPLDLDRVGVLLDLQVVPRHDVALDAGFVGEGERAQVTAVLVDAGSEIESRSPGERATAADDRVRVDQRVADGD